MEPIPGTHIFITNFNSMVLVLNSIRKPKKLTIHGSNEKSYNFLVKGGEDMRLDQRIEQLFSVMNTIFIKDKSCLERELRINTFEVIPVSKRLGMVEWVNNTVPLRELIEKEL